MNALRWWPRRSVPITTNLRTCSYVYPVLALHCCPELFSACTRTHSSLSDWDMRNWFWQWKSDISLTKPGKFEIHAPSEMRLNKRVGSCLQMHERILYSESFTYTVLLTRLHVVWFEGLWAQAQAQRAIYAIQHLIRISGYAVLLSICHFISFAGLGL